MFMRMVQTKVKPGELSRLQRYYDERVVPALQKTAGCLYAALMQSSGNKDEMISMTLWESREQEQSYERNGLFELLMDGAKSMLAESSEWRVGLSKDMNLEYAPVPLEPTVTSYPIAAMSGKTKPDEEKGGQMYLRIVSVRIKPRKLEEYKELYVNEVIPALQSAKGCRHAYLMVPPAGNDETLSVTIWDTKEAADEYEKTGLFASLVNRVKHTFTDLYQWKMTLEQSYGGGQTATSEDLKVEGYSVVAGRSLR